MRTQIHILADWLTDRRPEYGKQKRAAGSIWTKKKGASQEVVVEVIEEAEVVEEEEAKIKVCL